ncbi:hypothetical protein J2X32_001900 [Rheinheimera pacifica]|nr:hypothetical protein [Rheinheimera pacifica]
MSISLVLLNVCDSPRAAIIVLNRAVNQLSFDW